MVGAHQAIFDRNLARDKVDQAAMHEVRRHATRALFLEHNRFALNTRKPANAGTDRTASARLQIIIHIGETGIFERLTSGINTVNDEGIDLALNLVIDAFVGVETPRVILGLHFARDEAFLATGLCIKARDPACARLGCQQVRPSRFDIATQRRNQTQTCNYNPTHVKLSIVQFLCAH